MPGAPLLSDNDANHGAAPARRFNALWLIALTAMLYFPTLGPTLGLDSAQSLQFAALVDGWWVLVVTVIELTALAILRRRTALSLPVTIALQVAAVCVCFVLITPLASICGLTASWMRLIAWIPAAALVIASLSGLARERSRYAEEVAHVEAEIASLDLQTRALIDAHARIVEEARSQSQSVAVAVRAALRIAHDDAWHSSNLRSLLDRDVRTQARLTSHRVSAVRPDPSPFERVTRRHSLLQWLNSLADAPDWRIRSGIALAATAIAPGVYLVHGPAAGTCLTALSIALALIGTTVVGRVAMAAAPRGARPAALLVTFWIGSLLLVAPSVLSTSTISPRDGAITILLTAPALTGISLLPLARAAGGERWAASRAAVQACCTLARSRRDAAASDLERARREVIAALHTHVQGRAAAAITAMDLAESGVSGTREILQEVLEELATLDIDMSDQPTQFNRDPVADVLDSWRGLLAIEYVEQGQRLDAPTRYRVASHLADMLVNAVTHGRARAISVSVTARPRIIIRVWDDGVGPRSGFTPGLGLRRIEESGGTWTLTRQGLQTLMEVRLPAAVHTASARGIT